MKTATVRQLRTAFPRLESWLAEGETIEITKHKKVVAQLTAPRPPTVPDFAQRFAAKARPARVGKSAIDLLMEERGA